MKSSLSVLIPHHNNFCTLFTVKENKNTRLMASDDIWFYSMGIYQIHQMLGLIHANSDKQWQTVTQGNSIELDLKFDLKTYFIKEDQISLSAGNRCNLWLMNWQKGGK